MGGSAKNARKNNENVSSSKAFAGLMTRLYAVRKMVRPLALTSPSLLWCLLFGLALAMVAPKARAWGDDGHRVVGELAWRRLSPVAQTAVSEALTEHGYESLAEAATWPDT